MPLIPTNNEKKMDVQDVEQLQQLEREYFTLGAQLGEVSLRIFALENEKASLLRQYQDYLTSERECLDNMRKKYGDGEIDREKWVFYPSR